MENIHVIDLGLSDDEIDLQASFLVSGEDDLDYFGPGADVETLKEELLRFLVGIGDNPNEVVNSIVNTVHMLVQNELAFTQKDWVWVPANAMLPSQEYKVPAWHIDGNYYDSSEDTYSTLYVPTGALTVYGTTQDWDEFVRLSREVSRLYEFLRNLHGDKDFRNDKQVMDVRKAIDTVVSEVSSHKKGEAVRHVNRNNDGGAIHTVPHVEIPRISFAIVCGTESEIRESREE